MADKKPYKLNWKQRMLVKIAMIFAGRRLKDMFGKEGWRGKTGAFGIMLTGIATICYGLACMVGEVTGNPISGVPCPPEGCSVQTCIGMIVGGFGAFSVGLSQYGSRRAITKLDEKVERVEKVANGSALFRSGGGAT